MPAVNFDLFVPPCTDKNSPPRQGAVRRVRIGQDPAADRKGQADGLGDALQEEGEHHLPFLLRRRRGVGEAQPERVPPQEKKTAIKLWRKYFGPQACNNTRE